MLKKGYEEFIWRAKYSDSYLESVCIKIDRIMSLCVYLLLLLVL